MSSDMPVFAIKAKDMLAVPAIQAYENLCREYGLSEQADEVEKAKQEMLGWQLDNRDTLQWPDHPHVPWDPRLK
jgi:hypothetical protein